MARAVSGRKLCSPLMIVLGPPRSSASGTEVDDRGVSFTGEASQQFSETVEGTVGNHELEIVRDVSAPCGRDPTLIGKFEQMPSGQTMPPRVFQSPAVE